MGRRHGMELEDQAWLPGLLRDCMTEYLAATVKLGPFVPYVAERLRPALEASGSREVVDLGSGGGGAMPAVAKTLAEAGLPMRVTLTDKFPNREALARVSRDSDGAVTFREEPVDATAVPEDLDGVRSMLLSFHHFRPEQARAILADAVRSKRPIALFEGTENRLAALIPFVISVPIMVLLLTPFVRPFRVSRLLLTYLVPVLPLAILWDGVVSHLRTYSEAELEALTADLDAFDWSYDRRAVGPMALSSLVGTPR